MAEGTKSRPASFVTACPCPLARQANWEWIERLALKPCRALTGAEQLLGFSASPKAYQNAHCAAA